MKRYVSAICVLGCAAGASGCDYVFRLDPISGSGDGGADMMVTSDGDRGRPSSDCALGSQLLVSGILDTVFDPSERSDGRELFGSVGFDIVVARRAANSEDYDAHHVVSMFTSSGNEFDPNLAADGQTIFFLSSRLGSRHLFAATRTAVELEFASTPAEVITDSSYVEGFDISRDMRRLYASDALGQFFLMVRVSAQDLFERTMELGTGIHFPSIAGDELTVYYHRDATSGTSAVDADIYRRTRPSLDQAFGAEEKIATGADASISDDGRTLTYKVDGGLAQRKCP